MSKFILLIVFLMLAFSALAKAKPSIVDDFWSQWCDRHLALQTKEGQRFVLSHGRYWRPSIIPALVRNVEVASPAKREERSMVYGLAVTYIPDRKQCKIVIAQLQGSQDKDLAAIASDFRADIEDDERGEAWPKGFTSGH